MNMIFLNVLLMLGFSMTTNSNMVVQGSTSGLFPQPPTHNQKCRTNRVHSLLQTACNKMDLNEVPQNLKTSIQVLDVIHNRIRTLHNKTFERYPNLAFLYLAENFIFSIEKGTFDNLYYLEVLDLSVNAVSEIPHSVFRLPYLRTLYASDNTISDSSFNGMISSPLSHVDLSKNSLTRIPNLGPTADLRFLNLSLNRISRITVDDIAPFCSLKVLDLRNNTSVMWDFDGCDCQLFVGWAKEKKIDVKPQFQCSTHECEDATYSNETIATWKTCMEIIKNKELAVKTRTTWILVATSISMFCAGLFIILCCIHKRNKKRRLRQKEEQKMAANSMQNTELLHNQRNT